MELPADFLSLGRGSVTNTSLNGDIPNGVLNVMLYAQSASSIFFA